MIIYLSGFAKCYLQDFVATVSFDACSVLDHLVRKKTLTSCSWTEKKQVFITLFTSFPIPLPLSTTYHVPSFSPCHKTLLHLKSASAVQVVCRVMLIF